MTEHERNLLEYLEDAPMHLHPGVCGLTTPELVAARDGLRGNGFIRNIPNEWNEATTKYEITDAGREARKQQP